MSATQPTRERGKRARKEPEPYVDAQQHVRNIALLESLTELQGYVKKHSLMNVIGDSRWSGAEAELIEAELNEKSEFLQMESDREAREMDELKELYGAERKFPTTLVEAGWRLAQEGRRFYAKNDNTQAMTILHDSIEGAAEEARKIDERRAAEENTGARLFKKLSGYLVELTNLGQLNELIEKHALNDLIDGAGDARFTAGQASKLKFMIEATCKRLTPDPETSPANQMKGAIMSAGAAKKKATQADLPTMEDRKMKELHDLAERYSQIKVGMRELKTEQDDLARKMAQIMHRQKKMVYRCDGLVITLEEVEKVKVTTGKSEDEE